MLLLRLVTLLAAVWTTVHAATKTGYVMDKLCLNNCANTPFGDTCTPDNTHSYYNPQDHTGWCLLISGCIQSGYALVGTEPDEDGRHPVILDLVAMQETVLAYIRAGSRAAFPIVVVDYEETSVIEGDFGAPAVPATAVIRDPWDAETYFTGDATQQVLCPTLTVANVDDNNLCFRSDVIVTETSESYVIESNGCPDHTNMAGGRGTINNTQADYLIGNTDGGYNQGVCGGCCGGSSGSTAFTGSTTLVVRENLIEVDVEFLEAESAVALTVTLQQELGWLAIGSSPENTMVGTTACIAKADGQRPMLYNIGGKSEAAIVQAPTQNLLEADFTQDGTTTVLKCTVPVDLDLGQFRFSTTEETPIVVAWGDDNTFGYHGFNNKVKDLSVPALAITGCGAGCASCGCSAGSADCGASFDAGCGASCGCSTGCDAGSGCSAGCGADCGAGCDAGCGDSCGTSCGAGCGCSAAGCDAGCGCSAGCGAGCGCSAAGCDAGCGCSAGCGAGCDAGCGASCGTSCGAGCGCSAAGCDAGCGCSAGCGAGCGCSAAGCDAGCGCSAGCGAGCGAGCDAGCGASCGTNCGVGCSCSAAGCDAGCGCSAGCGTSCGTGCGCSAAGCDTGCGCSAGCGGCRGCGACGCGTCGCGACGCGSCGGSESAPNRGTFDPMFQHYTMVIPKIPDTPGDAMSVEGDVVGIMTNGVLLDSHQQTWAYDVCNGHSDTKGQYHYHIPSICFMESMGIDFAASDSWWIDDAGAEVRQYSEMAATFPSTGEPSPVIGFALDGYPIYGLYGEDGTLQRGADYGGDVDECNGKLDSNGNYGYYITADPPFSPMCLKGSIGSFAYSTSALTCPRSGIVNTILDPDPMITVTPAPIPPTVFECDDDRFTTFYVEATDKYEPCVWLAARMDEFDSLCEEGHPSQARAICRETCGACADDCEDTDGSFMYMGIPRTCLWLSIRNWIIDKPGVCDAGGEVAIVCPETCGTCDVPIV